MMWVKKTLYTKMGKAHKKRVWKPLQIKGLRKIVKSKNGI
jgi:hypothetical protein